MKKIKQIWKSRKQIFEGIWNYLFKKIEIEEIAYNRMMICIECPLYDLTGEGCLIPGTQPCCNQLKGGCGCKLELSVRSMSKSCPHPDGPRWKATMTEEEQDKLYTKIKYDPDKD